ncbi:hypothetical protein B0O99DRAFT_690606 [Bisporella sp. PMI_857]|nr:hypothetical protein B0O99DRAFT_690606 [Bisporella sp. PMI_857]
MLHHPQPQAPYNIDLIPYEPPRPPPPPHPTHQAIRPTIEHNDLETLANTATQQYLELAREERGLSELEIWRRNANGPPTVAPPLHDHLQVFTPPPPQPAFNPPQIQSWTPISQAHLQTMAHHHHQAGHNPYYNASSPTSPGTGQYTFDPIYHGNGTHHAQTTRYPSSVSSNDPLISQEEADLKRLRNTAASARFRAKKKRREQSLERSAAEKKTKLDALEARIRDLEAENKWLKDLIMERNDVRSTIERYEKEVEDRGRKPERDGYGDGSNGGDEEGEGKRGRGRGNLGRGDGNGMGVG